MKEAILLTGGTSYIGEKIIRHFIERDNAVHILVRPSSVQKIYHKNIYLHVYDGTYQSLAHLSEIKDLKVVFHLASMSGYDCPADKVDALLDVSLKLGVHLLEALTTSTCRCFINTGTYWQHYGETGAYNPVCLYAASKQAFEDILEYYVQSQQFKIITLKLFDVYGPNDPRKKLFQFLQQAIETNQPLAMSSGTQLLDLVYIDDVVAAYSVAADSLKTCDNRDGYHKRYFVSSGQLMPLKQVVVLYMQISKQPIKILWGRTQYRERQILNPFIGDIIPGWSAKVSLKSGIEQLINNKEIL